jgi:hypothetical protein
MPGFRVVDHPIQSALESINVSLAQPRPHLLFEKYQFDLHQVNIIINVRRVEGWDCTYPQDLCHHKEM